MVYAGRKRTKPSKKSPVALDVKNRISRNLTTKLRYFEQANTITPGAAGTCGVFVYRCNGMYDPYAGVGGHQPRGFDQVMALYDHFLVTYATISVKFAQQTSTGNRVIVGVALMDNSSPASDVRDYIETGAKYDILPAGSISGELVTINNYVNPLKYLGANKGSDRVRGTTTSDPTDQCYFHIFACDMGTTSAANITFSPMITYTAELFEPRVPPLS